MSTLPSANQLPASQRPIVIVLWLIFFCPVGLVLLWQNPSCPRRMKQVITGLFAALFVGYGVYFLTPTGRADLARNESAEAKQEVASAKKLAYDALPDPVKRFPDIAKFPALVKVVDEQTNDDPPLPRLRGFQYKPKTPDTIYTEVDVDINKNFGEVTTEGEVASIYKSLYKSPGIPLANVVVRAFGPLKDKYGNTSHGVVYGTSLGAAQASKVNWNDDETDLATRVLPGVCSILGSLNGKL